MPHWLKIAEPDELPPGKGKILTIAGREITVCNREARYVATSTWAHHLVGSSDTTCSTQGHKFDVAPWDAPQAGELHLQVVVREDGVYVLLEEGHVHPGGEPRA